MRIRFVGYAGDCIITAALEIGDGRLTDLLNGTPRVRLLDGTVEALDDGRVVAAGEVSLELGELFAARALDERARRSGGYRQSGIGSSRGPVPTSSRVCSTPVPERRPPSPSPAAAR